MNDLRTAAQQALEALEYGQHSLKQVSEYQWESRGELAMHALRAALAQQAEPVEPVAWLVTTEMQDGTRRTYPMTGRLKDAKDACDFGEPAPLYFAPPQRKPLTQEEIPALAEKAWTPSVYCDAAALLGTDGLVALVRAVEQAHGIKE